jgi:hypothetical protein
VERAKFERTFLIFHEIAKIYSGDLSSPASHPLASPFIGSLTTKVCWARSHLKCGGVTRWASRNAGQNRTCLAALTARTLYSAERRAGR